MKCKVPECKGKSRTKGLCVKHYTRLRTHGDFTTVLKPGRDRSLDEMLRSYNNSGISINELANRTELSIHCVRSAVMIK